MQVQRIILVGESPILIEMFHRAIEKVPSLQIAGETMKFLDLPAMIDEKKADWVISLHPPDGEPPNWVDALVLAKPATRFLSIMFEDGNVRIKKVKIDEEVLTKDPSLNELVGILKTKSNQAIQG
jgi:hypothetical protein